MQKRDSRRIVIASRGALLFLLVSHAFPQPSRAPSFGFTPAAQPAGLMGVSAAIGDFNGDGNPDIATANGSNRITVVLGDGKGNFSQPIATTGLRGPSALTTADLNGDGKLDLVSYNRPYTFTTTPPNEGLSVLLGSGDGSFVEVASYPTFARGQLNSAFNPLVVADFDRDGRPDIAIVNASSNSLDVMLGNGDGTFRPPVSYATGYYAVTFVVTGDFNGDGNADLITVNGFFGLPHQTLTLLVGLGDGTFASPVSFPSKLPFNSEISGLAAADFNHDGNLDLIVSTAVVSGVTVYFGNGDGSFAAPVLYPSAKSGSFLALFSAGIAIGDVTADGNADAVTVNYANNSAYIQVFPGNGDGTFQTPAVYSAGIVSPRSLALADLNGDGRMDAILGTLVGPLVVLNGTTGPFLRASITREGDFIEQLDALFKIQVTNAIGAIATNGPVRVTNLAATPYTVVTSMSGVGWTCDFLATCSRNDVLEPGTSYPPLRVDVRVLPIDILPELPIAVAVSGGGSPPTEVTDAVTVLPNR